MPTDHDARPPRVYAFPGDARDTTRMRGGAAGAAEASDVDVPVDAGIHRAELVEILSRIPRRCARWIGCEAGWFPLLVELHHDASELDPHHVVLRVKEKYASLRYDAVCSSDDPLVQGRFQVLLDVAERVSQTVCEVCSAPARLSVSLDPYQIYKTICAACAATMAADGGRICRPYAPRPRRDAT